MAVQQVTENVYYIGSQDWDRKLFDALVPLPDGTSYNSYLIKGSSKTAVIDTVDPSKTEEYISRLSALNVDHLDYIISNHAEQDHSGSIPRILALYPDARIVTNAKCRKFLMDHLPLEEDQFHIVGENDTLELGGKTLRFILTPWVHWPETMSTYLIEDQILFSCDFFGSHIASSDLFVSDKSKVYEEAKRYYAQIMMPFRNHINKNLAKLDDLEIRYIAPSHGPIYQEPEFIIDAYRDWISEETRNMVIIPYISMHGSIEKMVHYLVGKLIAKGMSVRPFNLVETDIGKLAIALVDSTTIVFGTPTVLSGVHPLVSYACSLINMLKPKTRFVGIINSQEWGGHAIDIIKNSLHKLNAEYIDPVLIKGLPKHEAYKLLDQLADEIHQRHTAINVT